MLFYVPNMNECLYSRLVCRKTYDMSEKRHIVHVSNTNTEGKNMASPQKEIQTKLMKGLLDLIVLQFLSNQPMHGYQIITKIRKSFGVYFGPSTIYPLLGTLEKKGYVNSTWNMDTERPRKVYHLTNDGRSLLNFTEDSLNFICRRISSTPSTEITIASAGRPTVKPLTKPV